MDIDFSPRTSKRGRSLHQQRNSSPSAAGVTPPSVAKKRKLDINGTSPSTPKALQALRSVIGGAFNFGKSKEVASASEALETDSQASRETNGATAMFDDIIDEILAEENQDQSVNSNTPFSESHAANHAKAFKNGDGLIENPKSRRKRKAPWRSVSAADGEIADEVDELVLEEHGDNNVNGNSRRFGRSNGYQRKSSENRRCTTQIPDIGRKRKRDQISTSILPVELVEDDLGVAVEPLTNKDSGKSRGRHTDIYIKQNLNSHSPLSTPKLADTARTEEAKESSIGEDVLSGSASRPSRERRRPRRYSNEMVEVMWPKPRIDATESKTLELTGMSTLSKKPEIRGASALNKMSQPKSSLPSKIPQRRPRKSVTFGVESPIPDDPSSGQQDIPIGDNTAGRSTWVRGKKAGREKIADTELSLEESTPPGKGVTGGGVYTERRSSRPKAGALPQNKLRHSKEPQRFVDETSDLKYDDGPSGNGNLRHAEQKLDAQPPKGPKRSKGRGALVETISIPEDLDSSDIDDITCVICGGGESEPPNEILLCDKCDLATHQVCYGVNVIPEGDWLCGDCRPDEDEELILMEMGTVCEPASVEETSNVSDIEAFEYHLQVTQKLLLDKLTGRRRLKLYGLDEEYRKVHQVVEQTVLAGEGNSMLVVGARGSGKSAIVESVMLDLSKDHRENFHVVRLNGFIHTDDRLALREIWRQLGREMEVDDDPTSKINNYADTLASLLALLSHPSEISEVEANQTAKSVIFILDEFDLFTTHPRQTLLYNLFEIAQARKAPIAVLGLTTKIDVPERLEKRVKSRFSHRQVHLPLPMNLAVYWEICRQGLVVDMDELVEEGFTFDLAGQDEFRSYWESMINDLYNKDDIFKRQLQTHFYRSKSVSAFLTSCILPIANLTCNSMPLTGTSFFFALPTLSPPDSKLHLLQSLAELDLALLIAAARLNIILDTENCNFAMAYDEYSGLTSKHKIQTSSTGVAALGTATKVWGRDVAFGAWERLIDCELLVPSGLGGASGAAGRDGGRENKMWKVDAALDEIPGSVEGLSGVMAKWCREI